MLFAGTFDIQVRRVVWSAPNAHGNRSRSLGEPEPLAVYAVAPVSQEEPGVQGRRFSTETGWDVYAPAGTQVSAHDVVILPDVGECEVVGEPEIWAQRVFGLGKNVGGVRFTAQKNKG